MNTAKTVLKNSKWVWSGNTTINYTTKTLDRLVVIWASQKTLCCAFEQETSHILRSLYMKFEFNWPSGIQRRYLKMLTDGQPTKDTRVTGRLLAHTWAKNLVRTTLKKQLDPFPILLEGGTCGPLWNMLMTKNNTVWIPCPPPPPPSTPDEIFWICAWTLCQSRSGSKLFTKVISRQQKSPLARKTYKTYCLSLDDSIHQFIKG